MALALLGAFSSGQSQSGKLFSRYGKPLKSATLDIATGTVSRGAVAGNRAATTVVDFANSDLSGFSGVDTGNGFCEWFDAGVKGLGNASDLMNSIQFAYCSSKLSPSSGGPGGSVKLGFYEGYTVGGGPTTGVAVITLSGLPGNTASSSFFGGFRCFFIRIVFPNLVAFADGPIGYSWGFLDNGTSTINPLGSVFAGTWPFLSCVASCSGALLQVDGQGMTDAFDEYCPPGTLRSTFTFGTASGSFSSISMSIEEATDKISTVMSVNSATFPNPDILMALPAAPGHNWSASLRLGLARTKASNWILYFGNAKVAPPNGVAVLQIQGALNFGSAKSGRMLLCSINTEGSRLTTAHTGVLGSLSTSAPVHIPADLSLVCNDWCAQAVVLGPVAAAGGGNARLSSMAMGVVGTLAQGTSSGPVAEFVGSPLSGISPLTVNFTNLSTGSITSHAWSFGDGSTSAEASPSHAYTTVGTYTVVLSETGPDGSGQRTRVNYVTVSPPPPVAKFTASPLSGVLPLTVNFHNQSSGSITGHAWSFGDGGTSVEASPSHVYSVAGTYTVVLTETGPGGVNTRTREDFIHANVVLTQQALPAVSDCPQNMLTETEFNSWFQSGSAMPNGLVKPADSLALVDSQSAATNCNFYKWSEQMFLWLTSSVAGASQYGGGGGLVMNTQAFFDVSTRDTLTNKRHFLPHSTGTSTTVSLGLGGNGALDLPVIREKGTGRRLEVIPPVLSPAGNPLVMDGSGNEMQVGSIRFTSDDRPVLLDPEGKEIPSPRAILRSQADPKVRSFERRLEKLEGFDRSGLVQRFVAGERFILLDLFGTFSETEQGQADGNVLMSQNGSLVYYAISANNVFVLHRSRLGSMTMDGSVPDGARFPVTPGELADIQDYAAMHGMAQIVDSEALAVEIKTSWVEADTVESGKFIRMTATIPTYDKTDPLDWVPTGTRSATLALVGLHIAGSTGANPPTPNDGHPEMVWATFEHVSLAPPAAYMYVDENGSQMSHDEGTSGNWVFCANGATGPFNESHMRVGNLAHIVRVGNFEISASNLLRTNPWGNSGLAFNKNTEVIAINNFVRSRLDPSDVRANYIQIGTTWTVGGAAPTLHSEANTGNHVGTPRLQNTTIETLVQRRPGVMPGDPLEFKGDNCFSCHSTNTTAVSHVFDETEPLF